MILLKFCENWFSCKIKNVKMFNDFFLFSCSPISDGSSSPSKKTSGVDDVPGSTMSTAASGDDSWNCGDDRNVSAAGGGEGTLINILEDFNPMN